MKERNLTLNDFFEKEKESAELQKSKQQILKYIEELTFEQLLRVTEKKNRMLRKTGLVKNHDSS